MGNGNGNGNGNGGTGLATVQRKTVMGELSERYSMDPGKLLETIRATCIKGNATNEQVQAFLIVANRYGLDPFLKEIHAFAGQGGGIVPIVGIDGWSKIANSTGNFDGCEFSFEGTGDDLACTCTIYVKGRTHATRLTEYLKECKRNTPPWNQYTRRMLRHKAFMQCVRVAFGLGGIHDEDEARDMMQNEAGVPSVTTARIAALNAAAKSPVRPHPGDPDLVIDVTDASEPPADDPDVGAYEQDVEPDLRMTDIPNPCPWDAITEAAVQYKPDGMESPEAMQRFEAWLKTSTSKKWDKLHRDEQVRVFKAIRNGDPWHAAVPASVA